MVPTKQEKINELLNRGVEAIYPDRSALEKILLSGKKLTVYLGIDPTGELHIGHGVVLLKVRQLQLLGHKVIILIGGFTAMIGDPTDKLAARQPLTRKQVEQNTKRYRAQIGKILDLKKTKFVDNAKWFDGMKFGEIIKLASELTVQRLLERDMFAERMKAGKPIHLHEFIYPLLQGYDSVALNVDMEVGGNDQIFNMLMGRTLLRSLKNKEKIVLATKLLADPTGKKMGKSEGNMVTLTDEPNEMYGKVMSWPDGVIAVGFEIATLVSMNEVDEISTDLKVGKNPKSLKMLLAYKIVELYHGSKAAISAEEHFKRVFEQGLDPAAILSVRVKAGTIVDVLLAAKLVGSKSEARRLLSQGGIRVNGQVVRDENVGIDPAGTDGIVIQKGKRHFVKII